MLGADLLEVLKLLVTKVLDGVNASTVVANEEAVMINKAKAFDAIGAAAIFILFAVVDVVEFPSIAICGNKGAPPDFGCGQTRVFV